MPKIDPETAGILIANGCGPITAIAGSMIEDQRPPAPKTPHDRRLRGYGMLAGIGAVLAWAILRMM